MSEKTPTVRKNIRDLSNPLELRELNRQMEWIWRKILGGLDERAFSDGGIRQVTTTVEKIVATEMTADTIETNFLNAAIAKMMVAVIGVCDADYLTAVDANVENLIVRRGLGNSFTFENLKIIYAQIVSATIGELCVKASDGNYYTLDVDAGGKVTASMATVTDGEIAVGHTNAGKVILGTDIVAEELSTSDLFATFALVDKIDASRINVDTLVARAAFVEKLFATDAFVNALYTSKIYGGKSLEMIAGEVDTSMATSDVEFYLSESATELKGGSWQTVAPEWVDGKYMWMRVKTRLKDGTESTSEPTCIAGATGATGAAGPQGATGPDGVSITAVTEQYYLSSSKTTQSGGEWQTTQPVWSEGKYIWTRVRIDYSNGSVSYTEPYCDATWEVVNDVAIYTGANPPELPLEVGKLWIDTGVSPTVIRRWKGTSTSTDRDDDGWDTVSDLEEINEISNRLIAQQAEAQKAIDQLATAITIDTSGAHFYKPGYRDRSEVRIDQDSVDILVGGNVNSSFIAGGLILGNYMLWHPAAAGGLAFNLM